MKSLLFLLILDFSGSMYQKLNNEIKYVVLQENVKALNQSLDDQALASQTGILVFGLDAKKQCKDLRYGEIPTADMSKTVNSYRPGSFSKTPLGESIKRGVDVVIQRQVKKVVIFSDGADSCNQDPCQELVRANDKLVKANYRMDIKFIGINLVKNDPKFECFRNNKLSNINIDFTNIGEPFDVQKSLQAGNEVTLKSIRSPYGIIRVKGAPANVQFKVSGGEKDRRSTWYGSYRNQLKNGQYFITADYPGTKKLSIAIAAEQEKEILWADFFKDPNTKVNYTASTISFMLTPGVQTQEAHQNVAPTLVEGRFSDLLPTMLPLPFGDWTVEIVSPTWLKANLGKAVLTLRPDAPLQTQFYDLFDIEWIKNPDFTQRWVVAIYDPQAPLEKDRVTGKETPKEKERYFLQAGVDRVPVPKGFKIDWIKSSPP